ncbi:ATP-binding protein [Magnetovibrio sp. PR-2]|uniref:cache domain-containing sensor histidine kinase n=1 Tax=Magnetovibrio sp. PR-2 TaxID=3120356 RepID=UPI002FCE2748
MHPLLSKPVHKASLKRNVAVLLVFVLCSIWGLVGYDINRIHNDRFETATVVSQNLVRSLTAHTETSFDLIRHQLKEVSNAVGDLGPQPIMSKRVTQLLAESVKDHKPLLSLVAVDANGTLVQAAISDRKGGYMTINPIDVSDREYFRTFADAENLTGGQLFVGRAIEGRVNKIWFIPVSYPRINPDGTFGGVILGSILLETFGELYGTFDLPTNASVALVRHDGNFVARTPFKKLFFERNFAENPFFTEALPKAPEGIFHDRTSIDQKNRILTYQSLTTMPLVVVLTQTYESILDGWLTDSLVALIVGAISTLIMVIFAWSLWRQADMVQRQQVYLEQAVEEKTQELKQSEEAAVTANRAKSDLLSIVSHELRTPLTSIKGSLELLANHFLTDLADDPKKLLDTANKNTERLVLLVNDILDMEKIISGKVALQLEDIGLHDLVIQEIEHNQSYATGLGVKLELVSEAQDAQVRGDRFKLGQVLTNLLSNGAKFSEAGNTVFVSITRENTTARISVVDHGCGISEEFQDKIFEKFSQSSAQERGLHKGSGLGLSIAQAIVQQHQGTIGFESQEGEGSTFYFELDVLESSEA